MTGDRIQKFFDPKRTTNKMSSTMPLTFNAVELCVVTIKEKPWTRAREVWRALKYYRKTVNIVKKNCIKENYTQKYQKSSVPTAVTRVDWPKDSQKFDIYIIEEGMYELLFSSQLPKANEFRKHCCTVIFPHVWRQLTNKRSSTGH